MKGKIWPAEWRESRDAQTGARVRQLTGYLGHSHHFYFTNSGWYDGGRRLLFGSARDNQHMMCSLDRESGAITQLTEGNLPAEPRETGFLFSCLNPQRPEAYYWRGYELRALDLQTLAERTLWEAPRGYMVNILSCTADGQGLCAGIMRDLSAQIPLDLLRGYVGFKELSDARPNSQIHLVDTGGGGGRLVHEEECWIGHVNASPTRPELITFCHEGPWNYIQQRIWGLNLQTGAVWKIKEQVPNEFLGHEYWMADGETLGYHGNFANGECFFGHIRYDNSQPFQARMDEYSSHFHSNDTALFVSDGMASKPHLLLWRPEPGDEKVGCRPRTLCHHGSSMRFQQMHAHPRFTADGSQVLFTSDACDYGNLYLVDVPEFESLPLYTP